jgi:hypothetical protein
MYLYKHHEIIREHLVWSGFIDNYFIWSMHGETQLRTESIIDESVHRPGSTWVILGEARTQSTHISIQPYIKFK